MSIRVKRQHYILDELLDATEDRNYEFKAGGMLLQKHSLMPVYYAWIFSVQQAL